MLGIHRKSYILEKMERNKLYLEYLDVRRERNKRLTVDTRVVSLWNNKWGNVLII